MEPCQSGNGSFLESLGKYSLQDSPLGQLSTEITCLSFVLIEFHFADFNRIKWTYFLSQRSGRSLRREVFERKPEKHEFQRARPPSKVTRFFVSYLNLSLEISERVSLFKMVFATSENLDFMVPEKKFSIVEKLLC